MVLQNYQKFIILTSNMIFIVALGVGFKCPRKIHLTPITPSNAAPFTTTQQRKLCHTVWTYNDSKVWALGRPKLLPLTSVSHGHNRTIIMALFCRSHNIVKDKGLKGQHNKITDTTHIVAKLLNFFSS